MKLLSGPHGWNAYSAVHISLRSDGNYGDIDTVLAGYSCYPPAVQKIKNCLTSSGRYDCVVQRNWFTNQKQNVYEDFRKEGVELQIIREW